MWDFQIQDQEPDVSIESLLAFELSEEGLKELGAAAFKKIKE